VRAWSGGLAPAGWAYVASDATPALQRAGDVGVRAYLSRAATRVPLTVGVDDVLSVDAPAPPPPPPPPPESVVLVGAGDIASPGGGDERTAALLDAIPGTVFTLGDNAKPNGTAEDYAAYYTPTWGRHLARTRPAVGNRDYASGSADAYFAYFGAAAGEAPGGYYSYEAGAWHVVVLNSNCSVVSCAPGSPQVEWLRADLAAHPTACTVAMWHHPRWSSGIGHEDGSVVATMWDVLHEYGVELALAGHDHGYERFAPKDAGGAVDPARGVRSFVVGTGGGGDATFGPPQPGSEVREPVTDGVLKLTLHPTGYDWEFVPVAGETFTDAGSAICVA